MKVKFLIIISHNLKAVYMSNVTSFSSDRKFQNLTVEQIWSVMHHRFCLGNGLAVNASLKILGPESVRSLSSIGNIW